METDLVPFLEGSLVRRAVTSIVVGYELRVVSNNLSPDLL
jgi:hypothetical protein